MMKIRVDDIELEAEQGDIANQPEIDAVVNAANAELRPGGGVAGAIHAAAGPQLNEECRPLAPIQPGEAVITKAYRLPNKYVIHCLGPVYGRDKPSSQLLADCYKNSLRLAEENGIKSVAFPAISTGAFGYPFNEALEITINTILKEVKVLKQVQKIKFVLHSREDFNGYKEKLETIKFPDI